MRPSLLDPGGVLWFLRERGDTGCFSARETGRRTLHILHPVYSMNHLRLIYLGCVGTFLCAAFINCSSQSIDEVKSLHHVRARDLLEKQQFLREALIEYQALVKLDPRDDEAQYQLALLHLKLGKAADVDLAHQALLKVIKLKPSRSDAKFRSGATVSPCRTTSRGATAC